MTPYVTEMDLLVVLWQMVKGSPGCLVANGCIRRFQVICEHIYPSPWPRQVACHNFRYSSTQARDLLPRILVDPKIALYDEKIKIHLLGFPSQEKVTLHGQFIQGDKKLLFASCGHYMTDISGSVDVTQSPSLGGTYTGLEPMGILWSLKPSPGQPQNVRMAINFPDRPCIVTLLAYQGHLNLTDLYRAQNSTKDIEPLASIDIERWFRFLSVTRTEVEEGNVRGALYLPPGDGPFQGIIDMFGSSGGIIEYRSALLASRGFAALSLPYFKYKDLPDTLFEVKYDYFEEAVNWLSCHPKLCKGGIGVLAVSKGVENALCMAAYSSKVCAAVIINGYPFLTIADMLYKGKILHKATELSIQDGDFTEEGMDLRNTVFQQSEFIPDPQIPERILQTYEQFADLRYKTWPQEKSAIDKIWGIYEDLLQTIWKGKAKYLAFISLDDYQVKENAFEGVVQACPEEKKKDIEVVKYPGAGHLLEPPYNPLCRTSVNRGLGIEMKWGGQPKEHALAQEDAWQRTLEFFRKNIPTS